MSVRITHELPASVAELDDDEASVVAPAPAEDVPSVEVVPFGTQVRWRKTLTPDFFFFTNPQAFSASVAALTAMVRVMMNRNELMLAKNFITDRRLFRRCACVFVDVIEDQPEEYSSNHELVLYLSRWASFSNADSTSVHAQSNTELLNTLHSGTVPRMYGIRRSCEESREREQSDNTYIKMHRSFQRRCFRATDSRRTHKS
ncbi:hypothetical protein GGU10DRAFT_368824 [Lentinula aff. detonsa]|uniref:Uncharacterized protein n=1 Tax=Lentinula aff. detonsa TaxID=2804958 RepID=A0AA38KKS5_9AGAR|nr:hypothetical protein GGU10DRAFT_368824 [Lentinula aff. detonsa]